MYKTADFMMIQFPFLRRTIARLFYQYLASIDQQGNVRLMNYGYDYLDPGVEPIPLEAPDESDRYPLQLYHRVASAIDLAGLDVLEVGSGRGGGASYIKRTLKPSSMTGVDFSKKAALFCQRFYREIKGLNFQHGDAENLPFEDESFDAVVNVESSHCYASMPRFLGEVARVLRPNGYLLWTDHRPPEQFPPLFENMNQAGFEMLSEESITENVLSALDRQRAHNRERIDQRVPFLMRPIFYNFAGIEGTLIYDRYRSGELEYKRVVLQKVG